MKPLALFMALILALPATASPSSLSLFGEGTASYLLVRVYDARLYAPAQTPVDRLLDQHTPRRLSLEYRVAIDRADIETAAWRTLERQHDSTRLAALRPAIDQLHGAMQSVQPGDRYLLEYQGDGTLELYFNEQPVIRLQNPELAEVYFGIWLGEPPLSPRLRAQLIGRR